MPIKISKPQIIKELIDVSEEQDESCAEPLSNPYRESLNQTEKNVLSGGTPEPHSIFKKMGSTRLLEIKQEVSKSDFSTSVLKGPVRASLPPELPSRFTQN